MLAVEFRVVAPRERARVSVEDGAREFGGFRAARALEEDEDCEPDAFGLNVVARLSLHVRRIFVRSETDEPALRAPSVLRRRGSGLAENVNGQRRQPGARGGAVCDRAAKSREQQSALARLDLDRRAQARREVSRGGALRDEEPTAVEERGVGRDELRGRDSKLVAVAEHFGDAGRGARQLARRLSLAAAARLRAEAEGAERARVRVSVERLGDAREEVVAGVGERLRGAEGGRVTRVRAGYVEVFALVSPAAEDARPFVERARAQGGERREGFDGRAGRRRLLERRARVRHSAHAPRL